VFKASGTLKPKTLKDKVQSRKHLETLSENHFCGYANDIETKKQGIVSEGTITLLTYRLNGCAKEFGSFWGPLQVLWQCRTRKRLNETEPGDVVFVLMPQILCFGNFLEGFFFIEITVDLKSDGLSYPPVFLIKF
jgi:hypothetical protein